MVTTQYNPEKKYPIIALALSFIIPGLGQIYNGLIKKGIILISLVIIIWAIIFFKGPYFSNYMELLINLLYFVFIILWLYGMYDAYITAKKLNKGEVIEGKLIDNF